MSLPPGAPRLFSTFRQPKYTSPTRLRSILNTRSANMVFFASIEERDGSKVRFESSNRRLAGRNPNRKIVGIAAARRRGFIFRSLPRRCPLLFFCNPSRPLEPSRDNSAEFSLTRSWPFYRFSVVAQRVKWCRNYWFSRSRFATGRISVVHAKSPRNFWRARSRAQPPITITNWRAPLRGKRCGAA